MPPQGETLKLYQDLTEIEQKVEVPVILRKHAQLHLFSGPEAKPSLLTHWLLLVFGEST